MKLALRCVAASVALVAMLVALAHVQGSSRSFGHRKGHIVASVLTPAGAIGGSELQELALRSSTGLEVHGRLRVPREGRPPYAGVVLVGGIKRGSRIISAAGLDTMARHSVIVALDYPLKLRRSSWRGAHLVPTVLRLRPAAFDTVTDILLLLDYLESRPDVDRRRLLLLGGSLGAVMTTVAGGVDRRPTAVVVLYGGGHLGPLVTHTLVHPAQDTPYPPWKAALAGHALAWLLTPLTPERYAPAIAPRPLLMVNGVHDSLVPRASVLALYDAARDPKELVWVEGEHIQPSETELLTRLSGIVTSWLVARGLLPSGPA